jgi:hypothetical protein
MLTTHSNAATQTPHRCSRRVNAGSNRMRDIVLELDTEDRGGPRREDPRNDLDDQIQPASHGAPFRKVVLQPENDIRPLQSDFNRICLTSQYR